MSFDLNELRRWHANKAERQIELGANVKAATAGEVHRKRAELQRQAEFHLNAVRAIDADPRQVDDASYELGRLLNHIYGDHGQTVAQHGWKKAAADALAKVSTAGVQASESARIAAQLERLRTWFASTPLDGAEWEKLLTAVAGPAGVSLIEDQTK